MRPSSGPMPHGLRGAAYDPHHQVTVIHGGEGANYGTCVYDLYANTWTAMDPPAPRPESSLSQPGFTYDAVHRVFVLFGSQFDDDERTWAYDLRKNAWRVLEAGRPPANREKEASPVLAADTRSGIVLCSIRRAGAHETWALDAAKPAWTRLNLEREPDPSGSRNRVLVYLEDRNLFFLENNTPGGDRGKREQQVWTFRWAEAPAPPRAVALTVTTEEKAARLTWETPRDGPVTAWNVYRGEGARPWEVALQRLAEGVKGDTFRDTGLARGATCFYQVRPVDASGKEGPPSRLGRTQPPVPALDLVVSVVGAKRVDLAWEKSPAEDVVGYHVERADAAVYASAQVRRIAERYRTAEDAVGAVRALGAFRRLTASPLAAPAYVDDTADLAAPPRQPAEPLTLDRPLHKDQVVADGKPYGRAVYAYRVVAVNRLGAESGPSPWRLTIPGAPQHVFAKEEGKAAARLKWQPRPEKGLKGYHVYRHDGRYDKEPIVRLTAEPVQATEFVDEAAGAGTRRYEVAAVDALGQVGEPSQPVWSRREWRAFYVPYTGEWHQ